MPRKKIKLSIDRKAKRYKKFYRGRYFYFPFKDHPTPEDAWSAWLAKKAEVDLERQANKPHREEYQQAVQHRQHLAQWCRQAGEIEQAKIFDGEAEALLAKFTRSPSPPPLNKDEADPLSSLIKLKHEELKAEIDPDLPSFAWPDLQTAETEVRAVWEDRLNRLAPVETEYTVKTTIEFFLAQKLKQVEAGTRSANRYAKLKRQLTRFQEWIGPHFPMEDLTSKNLIDWHSHLGDLIKKNELKSWGAHSYMQSVQQLIKFGWRMKWCDLPRMLNSEELQFALPTEQVQTFDKEEIDVLLAKGAERTVLYILLGLNCGMTQADAADLKQTEVDWDKGRIKRKRTKTQNHKNVPEVDYALWPRTFNLLKKHRNEHSDLVLTNRNGEPLKVETIQDGKHTKKDNIRSAFVRLQRKTKIDKPFKLLRKTGATKLGEHPHYRTLVDLYLSHSPRTIAERHYQGSPGSLFDEAIEWLGKQFNI